MSQSARRVFTLVELLVVIAIISVLASLLLPTLQQAMDAAQASQCLNNQKQLGHAFEYYASDYGDRFPPVNYVTIPNLYAATNSKWHVFLRLYITDFPKDGGIYSCPKLEYKNAVLMYRDRKEPLLSGSNAVEIPIGFGINYFISEFTYSASPPEKRPNRSGWRAPSRSVLAADWAIPAGTSGGALRDPWFNSSNLTAQRLLAGRHSFNYNTLFMDGHAENTFGDTSLTNPMSTFIWKHTE